MGKRMTDDVEMSDEELDAIAGGTVDKNSKAYIDEHLDLWKKRGFDKNKVRRIVFGAVGRAHTSDALDYLNRVW